MIEITPIGDRIVTDKNHRVVGVSQDYIFYKGEILVFEENKASTCRYKNQIFYVVEIKDIIATIKELDG